MKRALFALVVLAVMAATAVLVLAPGGHDRRTAETGTCPVGQRIVSEAGEEGDGDKGKEADSGDYESHFKGKCAPVSHPESTKDIAKFNDYASTRQGSDSPREFSRALRQRDRLAQSAATANIPGTGGTWNQYGHGPLIGDDPTYPTTQGDGFGKIEGRINDFAYADQTKKLYAAVAQGGLWESSDLGDSWKSIGDNLPIQSTGAVNYTPAGGGTLIVATGDMAFSNDYAGVGTYWSTNDGGTWHKAKGAPDGALSFRIAVDPTDPNVVYLATGFGLYRSADAGRNFVPVNLPTGDCAGNSLKKDCFFANVVTDVAVQPTDKLGHKGGAVVAAVGWREGARKNFNGKPEAPGNGLYRSDTGAPGSFAKVPDSAGFTRDRPRRPRRRSARRPAPTRTRTTCTPSRRTRSCSRIPSAAARSTTPFSAPACRPCSTRSMSPATSGRRGP